jgi:hypothetical protein
MYFKYSFTIASIALSLTAGAKALGADRKISVGGGVHDVPYADGPASVNINMGDCKFSMNLKQGEHVKFNDPDVTFYRAPHKLPSSELPFLFQEKLTSGYAWSFEKRGKLKIPWFGLMCEKTSNFKWSSAEALAETSPALMDIFHLNSLKCPADFNGKKWIKYSSNTGGFFKELRRDDWKGFIVDYSMEKNENAPNGTKFCLVHGDNVIIGVSGEDFGLRSLNRVADESIENTLITIKFNLDPAAE